MHIHFIGAVMTLWHLISQAETRNINLIPSIPSLPLSSRSQSPSSCPDPSTPKSFTLRQITYLRYETSPYMPSPQPNTTQLVFELENEVTGVTTGCACQNVMSADGSWADDSGYWYACQDGSIPISIPTSTTDGEGSGDSRGEQTAAVVVKTSARIDWDEWRIAVNQTWECDESETISQFSSLTLTPTCTETRTGFQYIKECTAPDVVVSATSGESIIV
ncbi:hypothetical protein F5Y07DRAFT_118994 [Xylaria sp. FL0933]|nr:hypothetical protein F5Y07DRAFT_118994 [Xylaria sp. FL0933]